MKGIQRSIQWSCCRWYLWPCLPGCSFCSNVWVCHQLKLVLVLLAVDRPWIAFTTLPLAVSVTSVVSVVAVVVRFGWLTSERKDRKEGGKRHFFRTCWPAAASVGQIESKDRVAVVANFAHTFWPLFVFHCLVVALFLSWLLLSHPLEFALSLSLGLIMNGNDDWHLACWHALIALFCRLSVSVCLFRSLSVCFTLPGNEFSLFQFRQTPLCFCWWQLV